MLRIYLDFETRSEVDIKKVGAWVYSRHPSTVPLCLGYSIDGRRVRLLDKEHFEMCPDIIPEDLAEALKNDKITIAHNAFFEQCIWMNILVARWGWPPIPIEDWLDTMAKARTFALPGGLGDACNALNLPVRKGKTGAFLIPQLCSPRKETKNITEKWDNDPIKLRKLYAYDIRDVRAMIYLDRRLPDPSAFERKIWIEDQYMNLYGATVDTALAQSCIKLIKEYEIKHTSNLGELTGGVVTKATQVQRLKAWLGQMDIEVTSLDKASILRLKEQGISEEIAHILWVRQQFGKSSTAKYARFIQMTDTRDHRTRGALEYHRTSTGRWGGRGVQLHNLPRGNATFGDLRGEEKMEALVEMIKYNDIELMELIFPDVMGVFSSAIRGMIIPEKGTEFVVADYGQIEARVVMWLADEQLGLDKFRRGEDLYLDMAERVYQRKGLNKNDHNEERQLGKATVLGAGFQMGWRRFQGEAKEKYGLTVSVDLAKEAVKSYRSTYIKVVKFWYDMQEAAMTAVREKRTVQCGRVKFGLRGGFLLMQLPSKRFLAYYQPRIMKKTYTEAQQKKLIEDGEQWKIDKMLLTFMVEEEGQWRRTSTYGGNLVAHCVQATARDIMAHGLLNVKAHGKYRSILTIHDELITQAPIGQGDVDELCGLMCDLPEWAEGIPIVAEGWKGRRYHK